MPFSLRQEQRLEIFIPQDVADMAVVVAPDIFETTFQRDAHEDISDLHFDATKQLIRATGLPVSRDARPSLVDLADNEDALILSASDLRAFTAWWRLERRNRDRLAERSSYMC
jgi:hypothetical protein